MSLPLRADRVEGPGSERSCDKLVGEPPRKAGRRGNWTRSAHTCASSNRPRICIFASFALSTLTLVSPLPSMRNPLRPPPAPPAFAQGKVLPESDVGYVTASSSIYGVAHVIVAPVEFCPRRRDADLFSNLQAFVKAYILMA